MVQRFSTTGTVVLFCMHLKRSIRNLFDFFLLLCALCLLRIFFSLLFSFKIATQWFAISKNILAFLVSCDFYCIKYAIEMQTVGRSFAAEVYPVVLCFLLHPVSSFFYSREEQCEFILMFFNLC